MVRDSRMDGKIRAMMKIKGWDKLTPEELREEVAKELEVLVNNGLVERLIGEDGEFYYKSTGKK